MDGDGRDAPATGPTRAEVLGDAATLVAYLRRRFEGRATEPFPRQVDAHVRVAAVLAPIYARQGRPYLLFTRRAATLAAHSGEISFPGGSHEATDTSLAATALRETFEELGADPAPIQVLGQLQPVFAAVSNFFVTPYVGWLGEELPPLTPNRAEVAEVIEAPLAALADPAIFHEEIWTRRDEAHTIYFYDLAPHRIWGLTGRILHQFLAELPAR